MSTKQAQDLAPGDVVDVDGHALTVSHLFGFMGLVGIAWTDTSYDSVVREPHDLITVTAPTRVLPSGDTVRAYRAGDWS